MKENKSFIQALKTASQAANAKNSLPILDYFLVDGNTITITNLEVTMKVQFEGEPFNACLPIETVLKGLKHVNGDFDISINGGMAKFKAGDFEFDVPVDNVDNFPKCNNVECECTCVDGISIGEAIKFVEHDEFRPVLNGVAFIQDNGTLSVVSASGHCLYEQKTDIEFNDEFVIPIKACLVIKDVCSFKIASNEKNIFIKYDNVELTCRKIEGVFPKYKTLIPQTNSELNISWDKLASSVERVSEFSNRESKLVKFNIMQNSVEVSCQDIGISVSSKEKLDLLTPATPIEIGFKASYIIQALRVGRGNINYTEPNRAITVKDENKTVLVMPMSLQ